MITVGKRRGLKIEAHRVPENWFRWIPSFESMRAPDLAWWHFVVWIMWLHWNVSIGTFDRSL